MSGVVDDNTMNGRPMLARSSTTMSTLGVSTETGFQVSAGVIRSCVRAPASSARCTAACTCGRNLRMLRCAYA